MLLRQETFLKCQLAFAQMKQESRSYFNQYMIKSMNVSGIKSFFFFLVKQNISDYYAKEQYGNGGVKSWGKQVTLD